MGLLFCWTTRTTAEGFRGNALLVVRKKERDIEMLRNVLVISDGGLVLFSKEFVNAVAQPRLVGSLLTAMLEFSTNNVGAPVCYIEMSTIAVSIISSRPSNTPESAAASPLHPALIRRTSAQEGGHSNECVHLHSDRHDSATPKATPRRAGGGALTCALFHDVTDGAELGRLIATELLDAFREQYGVSLSKIGGGTPHINLNEFDPFHARIPGIIQGLVTPVLNGLCAQQGVAMVLLMTDDAHISYNSAGNVDGLGLGASLLALTSVAKDTMSIRDDTMRSVVIENGDGTRVFVRRLSYMKASLVVQCGANVRFQTSDDAISASATLLEKLSCLL